MGYLNRVLGPEAEVLSCGDKKVPKETFPDDLRRTPWVRRSLRFSPPSGSPDEPSMARRARAGIRYRHPSGWSSFGCDAQLRRTGF